MVVNFYCNNRSTCNPIHTPNFCTTGDVDHSKHNCYETLNPMEYTYRSIPIPEYRTSYLKANWIAIYAPLTRLDIHVRYNLSTKHVDLRCVDTSTLEKCAQFVHAISLGFSVQSSSRILEGDCFTQCFNILEVKKLAGDHLQRAIGRIVGTSGKVKQSIENVTKTNIIVNNTDVAILGTTEGICLAKKAICRLVMGSDPGKVLGDLGSVRNKIIDRLGVIENIRNRID